MANLLNEQEEAQHDATTQLRNMERDGRNLLVEFGKNLGEKLTTAANNLEVAGLDEAKRGHVERQLENGRCVIRVLTAFALIDADDAEACAKLIERLDAALAEPAGA